MLDDDLLVPLVSDLTFGVLLLTTLVVNYLLGSNSFVIGIAVGVSMGYAIHTAVHMMGYSVNSKFNQSIDEN